MNLLLILGLFGPDLLYHGVIDTTSPTSLACQGTRLIQPPRMEILGPTPI